MSVLASTGLTADESKMMDSYIKAWPEKFQAKMKDKMDGMSSEGQKLVMKWYVIAKPSLDTRKNLDINNRFLYNIQEIANAYVKQHIGHLN